MGFENRLNEELTDAVALHPDTSDGTRLAKSGDAHQVRSIPGAKRSPIRQAHGVSRGRGNRGNAARNISPNIPELQRRGLFRTEYEGTTLRENLGLPFPVNRWTGARAAVQAAE